MALLLSDGFDSHGTGAADLSTGDPAWGTSSGVTIAGGAGKFGGQALRQAADTPGSCPILVTPTGSVGIAAYYRVDTSSGTVELLVDGNTPLLERAPSGELRVRDGGGTVRVSAPDALPDGDMLWVEVDYTDTGIDLWVGGDLADSYTGSYTAPDWPSLALLDGDTGHGQVDVDDFLVWDSSGSYFNTFGLLPRRIQLLETAGPGAHSEWTPLGIDPNWESVKSSDWTGGDGVEAVTDGLRDTYTMSPLGAAPGLIDAVVLKVRAESTGSTPAALQPINALGTSEQVGAEQPVPNTPGVLVTPLYTDANGVSWTPGTVSGTQLGVTLQSYGP